MSLTRGPQQQPIIRKSAPAASLLAAKPQILNKARASATLVSKSVTDRIIVGGSKLATSAASRPMSLRKPIVKPPKEAAAQVGKMAQHQGATNAPRIVSQAGGNAKNSGGTMGPPRPTKPLASIIPARKSLTADARRPLVGQGCADPNFSRSANSIVNKGALNSIQRALGGPKIVDAAAQKRLAEAAGNRQNAISRFKLPPAAVKSKVVISVRTPRTSSTEADSNNARELQKSAVLENASRPTAPVVVPSRGGGRPGGTVCVIPKGRAQIVGVNRERNTPAIVRRGIGVGRGGSTVMNRAQQPISASFPMVSRSGVPLIGRPQRRRVPGNPDPYGLDEMTAEDLDFIDDGGEDNDTNEWLHELRGVTGYDPSKFRGVDEARESNHSMMAYEERLSAQIARREDLEEFKKAAQESSDSDEED